MGQGKNRKISWQLPSWAKQTQPGENEFNLFTIKIGLDSQKQDKLKQNLLPTLLSCDALFLTPLGVNKPPLISSCVLSVVDNPRERRILIHYYVSSIMLSRLTWISISHVYHIRYILCIVFSFSNSDTSSFVGFFFKFRS